MNKGSGGNARGDARELPPIQGVDRLRPEQSSTRCAGETFRSFLPSVDASESCDSLNVA
jgi:hypothetical protein